MSAVSCASLRPTRPLGARSRALLRRFTATPRSSASMMRWTCRSGTPVTEAASFAVIRVTGLVAKAKSFQIVGNICLPRALRRCAGCQGRYPEFGPPGVSITPDTGWGDVAGARSLFPAAPAARGVALAVGVLLTADDKQ